MTEARAIELSELLRYAEQTYGDNPTNIWFGVRHMIYLGERELVCRVIEHKCEGAIDHGAIERVVQKREADRLAREQALAVQDEVRLRDRLLIQVKRVEQTTVRKQRARRTLSGSYLEPGRKPFRHRREGPSEPATYALVYRKRPLTLDDYDSGLYTRQIH